VKLLDPLAVAPFKVPPGTQPQLAAWLDSHGWPIELTPMTMEHADYWDVQVAPTVKRIEFERLVGIRPGAQPRADAYWPYTWRTLMRLFKAIRTVPSGPSPLTLNPTEPQLWAVLAPGNGPKPVPIGMLLGLTGLALPPGAPAGNHHFAWLLTAAPEDHLLSQGIPPTLALGRVLLDLVIQISLASGTFGRTLLHADPRGGPGLMVFYQRSLMQLLDPAVAPNISTKRRNDGRYFYFDESHAGIFSMQFHDFRRGQLGAVPQLASPARVR